MPDSVNVPVLGPTPKGGVIAGGLAVVGVAGYLLYKHYTKPKIPPPGGSAYGAYGATGPQGTPFAYGYGQAYAYGYMPAMGGGGAFGGYPYYPTSPGPGYGQNPTPTTNAQWGQLVEQDLGSTGNDAIAAAIGRYLAGIPITGAQQTTILEAEAVAGPPPVAGLGGYPPKMHVIGPPGGGGQGGGGNATNPVTGLRQTQMGTTGSDIAWNASPGATSYQVTATKGQVTVSGTTARIHNISSTSDRGDQSTVSVLAQPAATGAQPATIVVHTRR